MGQSLTDPRNAWKDTVEEITKYHLETISHLKSGFESAVIVGEILTRVKGALKHGEWLPWIETRLPFSQRSAWDYMAAFDQQLDIRPKLEAASNLNWRSLIGTKNGAEPRNPQQLHESNFYFHSIRATQRLMGEINHEIKDHPVDSWERDKCQSLAAALEPLAELYQRLKAMIA